MLVFEALYNLGCAYLFGRAVAADDKEAVKLFRQSAEEECEAGAAYWGWCYVEGRGVERDPAEAMKWCHKSLEMKRS
jgi:TPR repeat protein